MKAADETPGKKSYWLLVLLVAVLGTASDLFSKYLAFRLIGDKRSVEIISKTLKFTCTMNSGIIWGLWSGNSVIFLVLTVLTIPLILLLFREISRQNDKPWLSRSRLMAVAFGLILSGAAGNLYDRLAYRAVRDFIDFYIINWPIFNIADTYITIGAVLIIFMMFRKEPQSEASDTVPCCCCNPDAGPREPGQACSSAPVAGEAPQDKPESGKDTDATA